MKAWKPISLCCLLALSLVSYALAGPTPTASPVTPGATTEAQAGTCGAAILPAATGGLICSFNSCVGTGPCRCVSGVNGHCVNGACTVGAALLDTFTLSSKLSAGRVCSINTCFRNGDPCVCPNGTTHGTCLDHDCKP
jgi:hypothetical protein